MKVAVFYLFLLSSVGALAQMTTNDKRPGDFYAATLLNTNPVAELIVTERMLLDEQLKDNAVLRRAKFYLIQGQVELARYELSAFDRVEKAQLNAVVIRYKAVAEFLQGRWDRTLALLEDPFINRTPYYGRICPLKILSKIAVRQTKDLSLAWERCQAENLSDSAVVDPVWMTTIVRLLDSSATGVAEQTIKRYALRNLDNDTLKRVLKLALYLNVEGLVVDVIDQLDFTVASDEDLRALLAHIYFRQGKLARAWKFIEGDTGVNVENIRGNIWLLRGNLEIAFAHFNLALQIKSNSHNAAERALPVAWALKQWKRGQELTDLMDVHEGNRLQLQALAAAFAVQMKDYPAALKRLERLNRAEESNIALEVYQLNAYVGLKTKQPRLMVKFADRACEAGDITFCWMLLAHQNWEDLPALIESEEKITIAKSLARELASSEFQAQAFVEEDVYVDQRDIDELDESFIKLVK